MLNLMREFRASHPPQPTAYLTTHDVLGRIRDQVRLELGCAGHPVDAFPVEIYGVPIYSYATRADVSDAIKRGVGGARPVVITGGEHDGLARGDE